MLAFAPIVAPSIWLKAWIVAPSAIVDAGAEHDMRLDRHVAAELGVVGEPDALGIDQGRAFVAAPARAGGAAIRARGGRARRGC